MLPLSSSGCDDEVEEVMKPKARSMHQLSNSLTTGVWHILIRYFAPFMVADDKQ